MNQLLELAVASGIAEVTGSFHPQESEHHRRQICNYYSAGYAGPGADLAQVQADQEFETVVIVEDAPTGTLDVGLISPPADYARELLAHFTHNDQVIEALQPLSMRQVEDILTMASTHELGINPQTVAHVMSLLPPSQGLERLAPLDPWYVPVAALSNTTARLREHFATPFTAGGVLLIGEPGSGKTQAASYIADELNLQGYRVDLAAVLSHYQALSEQNLRQLLQEINSMHAGVILLDELEKLFATTHANDLQARLLSQLLWWLQTKPAQIVCVATSNNVGSLPPELVRPGRFDIRIESRKNKKHLQQVARAYTKHHELKGYTVKTEQTAAEVVAAINGRERQ